ncbi:MAG: triose-phosphate isomerase [Maricaulaceae bacterium]
MAGTLIAGNWKMNGARAELAAWRAVASDIAACAQAGVEIVICPPATLLAEAVSTLAVSGAQLGGQACRAEPKGAFTGDLSAALLADAGARFVILGHSERRAGWGETDVQIRDQAKSALAAGLTPIVCVGEGAQSRDAGEAEAVIAAQVSACAPQAGAVVWAYEPIWAIGSGRTPEPQQFTDAAAAVRDALGGAGARARVLYGGSVTADNATDILALAGINGVLVGGASLDPQLFLQILRKAARSE